jgi:hypothetical protein
VFAIGLLPGLEQRDGEAGEPARKFEVQHLSLAVGALTETRARSLMGNNVQCSSAGRPGAASITTRSRCLREQQMTRSEQQTRHGKPAAEEAAGSSLKKCPTSRTDRSAAMPSYRVDFMNEFARNSQVHKVCQRSIVVRSARSPEQAGEAAKTDFARLEGIRFP